MRLHYPEVDMSRTKRRQVRPAPLTRPEPSGRGPQVSVLGAGERSILRSFERGEWVIVTQFPAARARYTRYAERTLRCLQKASQPRMP